MSIGEKHHSIRVRRTGRSPGGLVTYELLNDAGQSVPEVSAFLRQFGACGYSPNTLSAYAHDLLHFVRFLADQSLAIADVMAQHMFALVEYLRAVPNHRQTRRLAPVLCVPTPGAYSRASTHQMEAREHATTDQKLSSVPYISPGLAPRTINRILSAISSLYEYLILAEGVPDLENPILYQKDTALPHVADRHRPFMGYASRQRLVRRAVRVKTVEALPRPLSDGQITALVGSLHTLRDTALFYLMLQGGLRPGEALNLHLEDIEYSRQRVTIRYRTDHPRGVRTKSRRERVVDLLEPEALDAVSDYVLHKRPQNTRSSQVFLVGGHSARCAEPLSYHALVKAFERRCTRLGIRTPWLTPHALRHTHATKMWEGGMRELTLAKRLRHASVESTRVYTRVYQGAVIEDYGL